MSAVAYQVRSLGQRQELLSLSRVFLVIFALLGMAVGVDLFFLSGQTETYFAWTINPPLSAAVLGAGYLSSILIAPMALGEKYWTRAQISFISFLPGLALINLATLLHLDRFHFNSPIPLARAVAWGWVIGYAVITLALVGMLLLQRRQPDLAVPPVLPLPGWLRALFLVVAVGALGLSVILEISPSTLIPLWPWQLTPLVARMLGAFMAAQGGSAVFALLANDSHRIRIMSAGYILFVVLQLIALARYSAQFTLPSLGGVVYVLLLGVILAAGITGTIQARRAAAQEAG